MQKNKKSIFLSLCMIVKNEEQLLSDCLESVKELVDEIIIVDTGSTDSTVKIANSYNARGFSFDWTDDFSAARNISLEHAAGEWILVLDADERITPENKDKLLTLLSGSSVKNIAYYLNFRSRVEAGSLGSELIHSHARLFRNGLGIRFNGRIHEQIIDSVTQAGGVIEPTNIIVEHKGYEDEQMSRKRKSDRNISILKKMLDDEHENHGMACFYLGESYSMLKNWDEAIRYYELSILKKGVPRANRALVYQNLGTAYLNSGNFAEAIRNERLSIKLQPARITPHGVLAETAMAAANYDLAIWEWRTILDKLNKSEDSVFDRLSDHSIDPDMVNTRLGEAYFRTNDFEAAESCLNKVKTSGRFDDEANKWLAKTAFAQNDFERSLELVNKIIRERPDDPEAICLQGKIYGNTGKLDEAVSCFTRVLDVDSDNKDARISLGTIYLTKGDLNSAEKILGDIDSEILDPGIQKQRAQMYLQQGDASKAKEILTTLENRHHSDHEIVFFLAIAADIQNKPDEVLSNCDKALELCTSDPRIYCLQGNTFLKQDKYRDALTAYDNALQIQPDIVDAWKGIGVAAVKIPDYDKAVNAFEKAHRLQPDDVQIKRSLAAVYGKLGMHNEAEKYLMMTKNV